MKDNDWENLVDLAAALNASEELQERFHQDPRGVLLEYDIVVTDDVLEVIRRVLELCADSPTPMCVVPIPRPRPQPLADEEDD